MNAYYIDGYIDKEQSHRNTLFSSAQKYKLGATTSKVWSDSTLKRRPLGEASHPLMSVLSFWFHSVCKDMAIHSGAIVQQQPSGQKIMVN
jgi:hypothetical protein